MAAKHKTFSQTKGANSPHFSLMMDMYNLKIDSIF